MIRGPNSEPLFNVYGYGAAYIITIIVISLWKIYKGPCSESPSNNWSLRTTLVPESKSTDDLIDYQKAIDGLTLPDLKVKICYRIGTERPRQE